MTTGLKATGPRTTEPRETGTKTNSIDRPVCEAKPSIGIVGKGFVGSVVARYYARRGFDVKSFDIKGDCDTLKDTAAQDIVFLSIMLPGNGSSESEFLALSGIISRSRPNGIVAIKSTLVPGTTDKLQAKFPNRFLCFIPEFLTESTADNDFAYPPFELVGVTNISNRDDIVRKLLGILPQARITSVVTASEAEMFKTIRNSYMALKLTAFNQIYDVCARIGINYESVRKVLAEDPWIGDSHTVIWHKGKRGFSGKCLPKDLDGLLQVCKDNQISLPLFETAQKLNAEYLAQKPAQLATGPYATETR